MMKKPSETVHAYLQCSDSLGECIVNAVGQ
jgi:hypothetical protein